MKRNSTMLCLMAAFCTWSYAEGFTNKGADELHHEVAPLFAKARDARLMAYHCKRDAKQYQKKSKECAKAELLLDEIHPDLVKLADYIEHNQLPKTDVSTQFKIKKLYIHVDEAISDLNASKTFL